MAKDYLLKKLRKELTEGLDDKVDRKPQEMSMSNFRCVEPRYRLDKDVVLSAALRQQLDEAVAKIHHFQTIYLEWGFGEVDPAGKGVILNFYGPPGTGKTLTAEALAGSLGKRIMLVSIADLESKFMGDTSKNIAQVFLAAREEEAVLFFDEADTLLGKRLSSVTQGVDNEVNAMRSTLLIELERHEGVVIFATNFGKNYDAAFISRISQHIGFQLPGETERLAIWNKLLVPGIPLGDTREAILEQAAALSEGMSGREMRTCMRLALPKAVMAGRVLQTEHLTQAIIQVRDALADISNSKAEKSMAPEIGAARKLLGVS
ncbi:ATP-binding protein [Pseudomonas luteola]|uniref:ATP-binding protein n=1 Tax=Pseudomonas luteola TaxID=47886 RepID=UPI0021AD9EC2|nr:ATP-binding protein [Pseudomonas luteola]